MEIRRLDQADEVLLRRQFGAARCEPAGARRGHPLRLRNREQYVFVRFAGKRGAGWCRRRSCEF
ncbi:MAG: hypothetical protein ACLTG4_03385 [Oscillospiraceae bacterium]